MKGKAESHRRTTAAIQKFTPLHSVNLRMCRKALAEISRRMKGKRHKSRAKEKTNQR